jgi:signal peptidase II
VVTDFVSVGFGPLRTGIFNLADLAVIAGILWLLRSTRRPEAPLPEAAD